MINGHTEIIAHIGFPTHSFKSPQIYNPYFRSIGENSVVVPLACEAPDYPQFLRAIFALRNIRGALVTMPHKMTTLNLVDVASPAAMVAGACNAVKKGADGRLLGDMFDGEGFSRALLRKGHPIKGSKVLIVGCGGVGSAIAAALAAHQPAMLRLHDRQAESAHALAQRLQTYFPATRVAVTDNDPAGMDTVINASPLGMNPDDPLPLDVQRLAPQTLGGDVVMAQTLTPLLAAAQQRGCPIQIGTDMLFEQIPVYLEYFGYPSTDAQTLRSLAQLED